jgi:hypothetical protein
MPLSTLNFIPPVRDYELCLGSQLSITTTKGKEKVSPIGWAYLYLSANNGKSHRKREITRKREGRGGTEFMS